jgi:hypothetical protein
MQCGTHNSHRHKVSTTDTPRKLEVAQPYGKDFDQNVAFLSVFEQSKLILCISYQQGIGSIRAASRSDNHEP